MKSLIPWVCLVAAAGSPLAFASDEGLDAYRQGNYTNATELLAAKINKPPVADYYMGRMRLYGYGQLKNNIAAIHDFQEAAEKGFLPAQRILALYFLLEENNPEQALYWYKKAASSNDVQAQMYCAAAYLYGVGVKKNSEVAKKYYIAAAKNGDSLAQVTLAEDFLDSRHSANKQLGLLWLNKAVAQNNPEALTRLGTMNANGTSMEVNFVEAKRLLNLAIAKNYIPAMYQMGELALKQEDFTQAKDWFNKAAMAHYAPAEVALAHFYLQPKSPVHDENLGFLWMLKSAQNGSSQAQRELSDMYKNGKGVTMDENLAKEWKTESLASSKDSPQTASMKAAQWLSLGKAKDFRSSGYSLTGIFSNWSNREALVQNNYNAAPKMEEITRATLYKPNFLMINPNEIPINDYYDALASQLNSSSKKLELDLPRYAIDKPITPQQAGLSDPEILTHLQGRATLGDTTAQFALGQMYEQGIGASKDSQEAIKQYTLATAQQELRAEYNLGLLYLEGRGVAPDYQKGMSLLRDAAFKGNDYAQYALARIDEIGFVTAEGEIVVPSNLEEAKVMYDLAAANDYGLAQYRLAEILVREKKNELTVTAQKNRNDLIKQLYQGASAAGIEQAALPLAFFNAMAKDKTKQTQAFEVAKQEAKEGHEGAALLLGLLYDRGIGVVANTEEAMEWYQKAPLNSVTAYILGTSYSQGTGVSKDTVKGAALLEQAAQADFSPAAFNLAILQQQAKEPFLPQLEKSFKLGNYTAGLLLADYYVSDAKDDQKMKEARDIYQRLADKGDKDGQLKLGFMLDNGLGGSVDVANAQKWYDLSAEQGQVLAQYLLAHFYQLGKVGTEPDYALAKKWYDIAQKNYSPAAVALGFIYETVDDNYAQAFTDYRHAADKHNAVGLYNLGLVYEKGKGRATDFGKARELYQESADLGEAQAMTQLAGLYFKGSGMSRNEELALNWYRKAADLSNADALYQLGLLAETGVVVSLNLTEALKYYQLSSDKGNAKAKLALARMYQYGLGVEKDIRQAKVYYNELSELNNGYAQYQLAMINYNGKLSSQDKQWLQKAKENGNKQALNFLQLIDAKAQKTTSFIEPIVINNVAANFDQSANLMYLEALSEWNRGDEGASRFILTKLVSQFPDYNPAKQAYEQLNRQI